MTIQELLKDLGVEHREAGESPHVSTGWVGIVCPFCDQGQGNFGLGYNLERGSLNCWKCGPHRLGDTIAKLSGKPLVQSIKLAKQINGRQANVYRQIVKREHGEYKEPPGTKQLSEVHKHYLKRRGFDVGEIEQLWRIKGVWTATRLSWRIFIPITLDGVKVSFTTRKVNDNEDGEPKYLNARPDEQSVPSKHVLYGADLARASISIHEGPLDAWAVGPGGTATLGVGYTRAQLLRMVDFPKRIVCFDSEPEAQRGARKLCDELSAYPGETLNVILDSKDAAEALKRGRKELHTLRAMLR